MLRPNQILSIRQVRRNCKLNTVLIPGTPGIGLDVLALVTNALLMDLEPVAVALILLGRAGRFRHIHETRARVLHRRSHAELHCKLRPCLDLRRAGLASEGEGALIAAEVRHIRGHIVAGVFPFCRVVFGRPSVGTNVLVRSGLLAVNDEGVEEVMRRHQRCNQCGSKKSELHIEE